MAASIYGATQISTEMTEQVAYEIPGSPPSIGYSYFNRLKRLAFGPAADDDLHYLAEYAYDAECQRAGKTYQ